MIIKGLDNQVQKLKNQISQYPPTSLIGILDLVLSKLTRDWGWGGQVVRCFTTYDEEVHITKSSQEWHRKKMKYFWNHGVDSQTVWACGRTYVLKLTMSHPWTLVHKLIVYYKSRKRELKIYFFFKWYMSSACPQCSSTPSPPLFPQFVTSASTIKLENPVQSSSWILKIIRKGAAHCSNYLQRSTQEPDEPLCCQIHRDP